MPDRHAPIRMELSVNGEVRCVGGVGEFGVMNVILSWVRRRLDMVHPDLRNSPSFDEGEALREQLDVEFGALDSTLQKHVRWLKESLKPGDIVSVRILPEGEYDEPSA